MQVYRVQEGVQKGFGVCLWIRKPTNTMIEGSVCRVWGYRQGLVIWGFQVRVQDLGLKGGFAVKLFWFKLCLPA